MQQLLWYLYILGICILCLYMYLYILLYLCSETNDLIYSYTLPNGHIFVDSPSIRCRNSTWKVRGNYIDFDRRIHVENMASIRSGYFDVDSTFKIDKISVLHVDFSMSFRRQIDVISVLSVSILSFSNIFCSGNLF